VESETRRREQDLAEELKKVTLTCLGERLEREEELKRRLNEALAAKVALEEKAQDLTEQLEGSCQ